ncbi:serine/threonine protein kinase [Desulfopila sp. IMCC35006]|uniref:serine/threonine protein kinase n=1 Tax=Desulfopila sp. IMCC35006 TaxID=2569542 RepID=UPI0010AB838F|nr:serine/threonine-protein kinase [Desulfopila sp. IMCC35006]TKB25104.1 serine/threonine protein kinase [Desulfopila sp. IMCC35006]
MQSPSETILLFGLSDAETTLVKRLVSSFEIDIVPLTIGTVRNFIHKFPEKKICLVVFRVDTQPQRQDRVIGLIRDFVGPFTPFLLLIPPQRKGDIRKYLNAGADDFMDLPLNEERFSIGFLILLEMGQAVVQRSAAESLPQTNASRYKRDIVNRLVDFFREGLSYFAPKSLLIKARTDSISDKWLQVRKLGSGGFGDAWLVQEIGTGRLAVAKTPHSAEMNIRVLRSAAILKRLVHHPNIVHLLEIVKDNGKFILIQEYVEGPTLQQLLQQPIAPLDKAAWFLQLVSVISYAHKHKIMHRDIKPENIIINKSGQVKLLDFGIARDLSWQPPDKSSAGTVNFMPPEQFEGRSCLASDVWALGVILYIFATNTVPYFQGNDQYPLDIDTTVESRAPRIINPQLDINLERIIMHCLQKDLEKRYRSATELQEDLQSSLPQFGRGGLFPE